MPMQTVYIILQRAQDWSPHRRQRVTRISPQHAQ